MPAPRPQPDTSTTRTEALYSQCRVVCLPIAFAILHDETRAEGVVQRVWMKLPWGMFGRLGEGERVAYLTTAAKREAVRRSGARDRDRPITAAMANEMLAVDPEFDEEFACAERSITVQRMVERLPGRCREAMTLKLEGLTRREAADRMGISLKAYENQVSHNVSYSAVSQACWDRMFARQFCQRSGDMNQHR